MVYKYKSVKQVARFNLNQKIKQKTVLGTEEC